MIVIGFWSYKGGTGRSMAVANTAYAISRLGHSVAVVDLDIDAPGLIYRFGGEQFDAVQKGMLRGGGIAKFVDEWRKRQSIEEVPIPDYDTKQKEDDEFNKSLLQKIAIPVSFPLPEDNVHATKPGEIHLIPAGDLSEEYWDVWKRQIWDVVYSPSSEAILSREKLTDFVESKLIDAETELADFRRLQADWRGMVGPTKFFFEFRRSIEDALNPDYLLVELVSGISEMQGAVLRLLADKVVILLTHNIEGIKSFQAIVPQILALEGTAPGRTVQVIPVLTRLTFRYLNLFGVDIEKLAGHCGLLRDEFCFIRTEQRMEVADDLALFSATFRATSQGGDFDYDYRQLCNDYVEMISRILTESDPKFDPVDKWRTERDGVKQTLREVLALPMSFGDEKIFQLDPERGEIRNTDNARNVSLKVDTFTSLLDCLFRELSPYISPPRLGKPPQSDFPWLVADVPDFPELPGDAAANRLFELALRKAGHSGGTKFGEAIFKHFATLSPLERIRRWCDFDSDVGWGRFVLSWIDGECNDDTGLPEVFSIIVENNFLAAGQETPDLRQQLSQPALCAFLVGYIDGVLTEILKVRFNVDHASDDCMRGTGLMGCRFRIQKFSKN